MKNIELSIDFVGSQQFLLNFMKTVVLKGIEPALEKNIQSDAIDDIIEDIFSGSKLENPIPN